MKKRNLFKASEERNNSNLFGHKYFLRKYIGQVNKKNKTKKIVLQCNHHVCFIGKLFVLWDDCLVAQIKLSDVKLLHQLTQLLI